MAYFKLKDFVYSEKVLKASDIVRFVSVINKCSNLVEFVDSRDLSGATVGSL